MKILIELEDGSEEAVKLDRLSEKNERSKTAQARLLLKIAIIQAEEEDA